MLRNKQFVMISIDFITPYMKAGTDMLIPRRRKVSTKKKFTAQMHFPVIRLDVGCTQACLACTCDRRERNPGMGGLPRALKCIFPEGRLEPGLHGPIGRVRAPRKDKKVKQKDQTSAQVG